MLKVENLQVNFSKTTILHNISFGIKKGEIVGIIGPNGSGKTTLMNALSGFLEPVTGSILFKDEDVTKWPAHKRASIGFGRSFQNAGIFKEMTVEENLIIALEHSQKYPWWWKFSKKYKVKTDKIIDKSLETVALRAHKHSVAGVLSGGQIRLLELLRLQLIGGELILIDEPTAGVAPVIRQTLAQSIKRLTGESQRSIILIEHDLKFLFEIVDRVIVIVDGKIHMEGTPQEVSKDEKLKEIYFGK